MLVLDGVSKKFRGGNYGVRDLSGTLTTINNSGNMFVSATPLDNGATPMAETRSMPMAFSRTAASLKERRG